MTSTQPTSGERSATISRDELRHILGDIDDAKVIEILALKPSRRWSRQPSGPPATATSSPRAIIRLPALPRTSSTS